MAKPFKFRYVNEIVGTFVLVILALAVAGFVLAWRAQGWFEKTYTLTLRCEEGSLGLTEGSVVEILGFDVGSIVDIKVGSDEDKSDDYIRAVATIKGDFFERFVRADSPVLVKKRFGVAGDAFVEIGKGTFTAALLPEEGAELRAMRDTELLDLAENLISTMTDEVLPAIKTARDAVDEYRKLAVDLRNPDGKVMQLLDKVDGMIDDLRTGKGSVSKVLYDETFAEDVHTIVRKVKTSIDRAMASMEKVDAILEDVRQATGLIPVMAATLGREIEDLPGTMLKAQDTLRQANRLVRGLQQHWLIRGSVEPPRPAAPLPPSTVTGEEAREK